MLLKIDGQIPNKVKLFGTYQISIPTRIRGELGWKPGDTIQVYTTKKGIFLKKEE